MITIKTNVCPNCVHGELISMDGQLVAFCHHPKAGGGARGASARYLRERLNQIGDPSKEYILSMFKGEICGREGKWFEARPAK